MKSMTSSSRKNSLKWGTGVKMSENRLVVTCHHLQRHLEKFRPELESAGIEAEAPPIPGQQFMAPQMRELLQNADLVIAGDDFIDRAAIEAGKNNRLKAIIKWGIGTDAIDKEAARELGIPVYNTPGVFSDEVAELALSYLLLLARQLHKMHQSVLDGGWLQIEGRTIKGKTAGVIGLGSIGRGIASRCKALGMNVLGYDPYPADPDWLAENSVRQCAFDEVLQGADYVFLACNLTEENRHMMDDRAFGKMRKGASIINVGRGPLIDERALVRALENGQVAAAGLDVFEEEPLPADSPLRRFDQCVFGTHSGSNTFEAVDRVNRMTVDIALHLLTGKELTFPLSRVA